MLSRQERSHRALGHSRSDSILSGSAAANLLQGLSTPHASEFHFSSSRHSRNASSSTFRPPRPSRSPPPPRRRVVSNPPPLPTTLPTRSRVVPLIPGLGFHLAQRRAAEATTSNSLPSLSGGVNNNFDFSSPSSNYSHPDEFTSSDSDDCPPTESDRPDSVAPAPEVSEPWQESDNYQSPVWASRWSRRGSESSGTGTAGGRAGGSGVDPLDRHPSFSAFAAARGRRDSFDSEWGVGPSTSRDSSTHMNRRLSSSSSLRFDSTSQYQGGAGRGQPTARRNSNASSAPFPNFPFPFPGGARRGSKASLIESLNGVGGSSMNRQDSSISIRHSDDGDAWDDLHDPDPAALSRRSSYDSSFAFDHGRAASFSYSPTEPSYLQAKRKTSHESFTFGSLPRPVSRSGLRRNSSQGSLRGLPRPPPPSFGMGSGNSSITGGAGGLIMSRRGSWQSQMGLMISGGRMERNMSVDSVGEIERIRRLGGMRELNRRESEVLEMGWRMLERGGQLAYEENQWGQTMEPGVSHWSPSTAESPSSIAPGQHDDASSPELPDSSSSASSPTSPIYTENRRSHYPGPLGTYEERLASPLETLSPLPPSSDLLTQRRIGHRPQISLTFSFESSAKSSPQLSSHSQHLSDPNPEPIPPFARGQQDQDLKASRRISSSPGRLLAAMLADQSSEETTDTGSELEEDPTRNVEFAIARRGALSPVVVHNGKEFPMASTAPLSLHRRSNPPTSTPSSGSSDLIYLAQSIRVFSDSTDDIFTPLPALALRPTLRNTQSMSALRGEHGARTYNRLAAFNETKGHNSSGWSTSPFAARTPMTPPAVKTSYVGPSSSSEAEEEDQKDVTPRASRRRPNNLRSSTEQFGSASSPTLWEAPWTDTTRLPPPSLVYDKTPPMQAVGRPGQQEGRDVFSSTPSAHSSSSHLRRASANPPIAPIPVLSTKRSAISLPFERAFVQRAQEDRRTGSIGGSFASSSSSSSSNNSTSYQQCTGSAIHPDSGLCYCGVAYLSSSRRMSKPSARLATPHLPPPHLRLRLPSRTIDEDHAFDKSKIRFSMPAPVADPEVLEKIPTRSIPLPAPASPQTSSSSKLGGPKKVLSRLFATHRKTASSGTF
ncbi:hypothetical protein BDY24DRAFT_381477 [Mrakia frigida]|uniref:uncharacterized protein n=1 Tax=Mrakia frigida TaxID=29902 RepID=UPI003FCBFC92